MDLLSVAQYLDSLDLGLRLTGLDKNLFLHRMPESVTVGVLLREQMMGTPVDNELPGYYRTGFLVVVRHDDHVKGRALADSVMNALTIKQRRTVGAMNVQLIIPMNLPLVFPVSDGDLLEWSINFDAVYTV